MKYQHIALFLLASSLCSYAVAEQPIYTIHELKDGRIIRLNNQSGEVHLITDKGLSRLSENTIKLHVGHYYEMEEGKGNTKFLKYLGKGKFEPSKFAIHKISD